MRFCSPAPAGAPGSFFWGFARGQAGGRRPPAEGGHTGKARVGGCAAGPAARPPPPRPLHNFIPLHPRQRVSVSLPGGAI